MSSSTKKIECPQVPFSKLHRLRLDIDIFFENIMRKINNHIFCKDCKCEKSWHIWQSGYGFNCHGICANPDCLENHMDCHWGKGLTLRPSQEYPPHV